MAQYSVKPNLASQFSKQQLDACREQFQVFDADKNGTISQAELATVMRALKIDATPEQLRKIISEVDTDKSNTIDFNEFLDVIVRARKGESTGFGMVVTKHAQVNKFTGSSANITHSFLDEEKEAFVDYINLSLADDAHLKNKLPVNPKSMEIFEKVNDGILLNKLINCAVKGTVDERVLNFGKGGKPLNKFEATENLNLAINSAKSIGCSIVNIGSFDIMEGKPHLILGMIWQIIKIGLMSKITLKNHPELIVLLEDDEDFHALLALPPEQILLRWFNYHLKRANHDRRVNNFSGDIQDGINYTVLLKQIGAGVCDAKGLQEPDLTNRAQMVIDNASKLGVKKFIRAGDIVKGNSRLNLAFVAELFNTCPALEPPEDVEIPDFDAEGTREERTFRMWINSLGIDSYVNNLFEDLKDGQVLLQVFDKVSPGCVDWTKVNKNPKMVFKKCENCEYVLVLGKQHKFSLVGIGGKNFVEGHKTSVLALVWQLMRYHVFHLLKSLSKGGKELTDADILAWANEKVPDGSKVKGFNDPTLKTGRFIIDVLNAVAPRTVNYELVHPGDNDEQCSENAKYAINVARKIGCCVFLVWEDIVDVKPKMIMVLCGAIMHQAMSKKSDDASA